MKANKIKIELIVDKKLEYVTYNNITLETAIKRAKKINGFMYICKIEPVYY